MSPIKAEALSVRSIRRTMPPATSKKKRKKEKEKGAIEFGKLHASTEAFPMWKGVGFDDDGHPGDCCYKKQAHSLHFGNQIQLSFYPRILA